MIGIATGGLELWLCRADLHFDRFTFLTFSPLVWQLVNSMPLDVASMFSIVYRLEIFMAVILANVLYETWQLASKMAFLA
jgi:hypothetical protein